MPAHDTLTRRALLKTLTAAGGAAVARPFARFVDLLANEAPARELVARPSTVDLGGGRSWATWTYGGGVPGPVLGGARGTRFRLDLRNELAEPTTIHWHGLPVPPGMDGVPGLSQDPVQPGDVFSYDFELTHPGTYLYHSHAGLQLDRGLMGPLVVTDPDDPVRADVDVVVLLDDWLAGNPDDAFAALRSQPGFGMMGGMREVAYDGYVANGAVADPMPLSVARGALMRLRLINGAASTTFVVGVEGRPLTVTHADGQAVAPVVVDTVRLGMGERYDVTFRADDAGPWTLFAGNVDARVPAIALPIVVDGGPRTTGRPLAWPATLLRGRRLQYEQLRPLAPPPPVVVPVREVPLTLGFAPGYAWTINGETFESAAALAVREGERVRLVFRNLSMMRHPMHLHGHFFEVLTGAGRGPLKDTVIVDPMGQVAVEFTADNPGRWLMHCHHAYHMEAGMAREIRYA
ncbi:MAG: multicopper oxidase family protein [Acidobacteriota bacterium]